MDFNRTELRALLLATGLLLLGASARLGLAPGPAAVEWFRADSLAGSGQDLPDTRRQVATGLMDEQRAATPLAAGEQLDPNSASEIDLRRLPGVGPAKAAAIVVERTAGGPFRSLQDLARVPGIGPSTMAALAPHLSVRPAPGAAGARPRIAVPGLTSRIDVNRAQINELEQITGIGPVLAARIVETRHRLGRFRRPEDLLLVPGIGPGILQLIRDEVRF